MADQTTENENENVEKSTENTNAEESARNDVSNERHEREHDDFSEKLDSALKDMSTIKDLVRTVLDTINIKQNENHDDEIVFAGSDDVDLHDIDTDTPLRDLDFSM